MTDRDIIDKARCRFTEGNGYINWDKSDAEIENYFHRVLVRYTRWLAKREAVEMVFEKLTTIVHSSGALLLEMDLEELQSLKQEILDKIEEANK